MWHVCLSIFNRSQAKRSFLPLKEGHKPGPKNQALIICPWILILHPRHLCKRFLLIWYLCNSQSKKWPTTFCFYLYFMQFVLWVLVIGNARFTMIQNIFYLNCRSTNINTFNFNIITDCLLKPLMLVKYIILHFGMNC